MNILHSKDKEKFIAYNQLIGNRKSPHIIFLHGFMSNMNGDKALHLEKYCQNRDYNFIRFDCFGCGKSSGEFVSEDISSWLDSLRLVIDELTDNNKILLVGSSMGGWVALLASMIHSKRLIGTIGIASAPDCTEDLIWNKLTDEQKKIVQEKGVCEVNGKGSSCDNTYPISHNLILDGRKYLLLDKKQIDISTPVHLIHGMKDVEVSSDYSLKIADKLKTDQVTVKLVKDGDHRLYRPCDLQIITNSIEEILSTYGQG